MSLYFFLPITQPRPALPASTQTQPSPCPRLRLCCLVFRKEPIESPGGCTLSLHADKAPRDFVVRLRQINLFLSRSLSNGWIRLCLILIDTARLHASAGQPCPRLMRSSRYQPSAFDLVRCSTTRITKQIEQCRLSRQRQ